MAPKGRLRHGQRRAEPGGRRQAPALAESGAALPLTYRLLTHLLAYVSTAIRLSPRLLAETGAAPTIVRLDAPWSEGNVRRAARHRLTRACNLTTVMHACMQPHASCLQLCCSWAALGRLTSQSSVPSIWIGGQYVGGCDDGSARSSPSDQPSTSHDLP